MNRTRFSLKTGLLAWVLAALAPHSAAALDGVESQANDLPSVVLVFDPTRERAQAAVQAVESHLSGLSISVQLVPIPLATNLNDWLDQAGQQAAARQALGSFAIDATSRGELLVFFTEVNGEATLLRRIKPKTAGGRVALEEAGIVVASLVEALLEGRHVGMEPSPASIEASSALAEAEAAPAIQRNGARRQLPAPLHTAISLGYQGTSFASDGYQSGLSLGARTDVAERWSVLMTYTVFSELEVAREGIELSLQRHPLALGMGYEASGSLSPLIEVTAFADWVTRRTSSTRPELASTPEQNHWLWGVGSRIGAHWSPIERLHLHVTFGVDVPFNNLSYVVEGDAARTLLVPRSVRPQGEATLIANLW